MAIVFATWGIAAEGPGAEETRMNAVEDAAKGKQPYTPTREELESNWMELHARGDVIAGRTFVDAVKGSLIELKPGAYTDEEVERIRNGDVGLLPEGECCYKWRLWLGGTPSEELKAATPWEEDDAT